MFYRWEDFKGRQSQWERFLFEMLMVETSPRPCSSQKGKIFRHLPKMSSKEGTSPQILSALIRICWHFWRQTYLLLRKVFPFPQWRKTHSSAGVNPYTAAPASIKTSLKITAWEALLQQEKSLARGSLWLEAVAWKGFCNIAEADIGASESPRVGQKAWRLINQTNLKLVGQCWARNMIHRSGSWLGLLPHLSTPLFHQYSWGSAWI